MAGKKPTFKPRARLMHLLGDQLIRDSGIAVFELVKNSYDADAKNCIITLDNAHAQDGVIVVEDDGCGMTLDTVVNVWLEPGTDNRGVQRKEGRRSKKFKRLPLGEKGIGRFAAHKLGDEIKVVTKAKGDQEVVIKIDWREFDSPNQRYLSDVPISVIERDPEVFKGRKTGTRIEISGLRESWTRGLVRRLHRAVHAICPPIAGRNDFEAILIVEPHSEWLDGMIDSDEIALHALFTFKATVYDDSMDYEYAFLPPDDMDRVDEREVKVKGFPLLAGDDLKSLADDSRGKYEIPSGAAVGKRLPSNRFDIRSVDLSTFTIRFFVYDLENYVLKMSASDPKGMREYLKANGGVRVYRGGVRVYDYGEEGNDWLDLGGKKVNVPARRIGNNQVLGFVLLDDSTTDVLVEKTNREGFVENDAFRILRSAVSLAVEQAAAERNVDKDRIRRAYKKPREGEPVITELEKLRGKVDKHGLSEEIGPIIDRVIVQYHEVTDRLLVAAGAGLNLAVIIHQIDKDIQYLSRALEKGADKARLEEIAQRLSRMTDSIAWLLRDSPMANHTAGTLIEHALDTWEFRFQHHGIEVVNGLDLDDPDFEFKASRRLALTAIMNLIDNAIYWLSTKKKGRKLYVGTTYEVNGRPAIVVADTGPGLLDSPQELVQPFHSRKPNGMGLGLHIADEIMKQHKGKLLFPEAGEVTLPPEYDGAVLLLEFPPLSK